MTAFLFIPANVGSGASRRVDLANFASLFAESEEPLRRPDTARNLLRAAAAALLLLLVIGALHEAEEPRARPLPEGQS